MHQVDWLYKYICEIIDVRILFKDFTVVVLHLVHGVIQKGVHLTPEIGVAPRP